MAEIVSEDYMPVERVTKEEAFVPTGIPLAFERRPQQESCPMHVHEFSEIAIILGGSGIHLAPSCRYQMRTGDVFVLYPGQYHAYRSTHNLTLVNLIFQKERLRWALHYVQHLPAFHALFTVDPHFRQRDSEARLRLGEEDLTHVRGLLRTLQHEFEHRRPGWGLSAVAHFMLVLRHLCECYSVPDNASHEQLLRLGEVISYIAKNYPGHITLERLAEVGHMSRRTFSRVFKQAMNCTPMQYVNEFRIAEAKERLQSSESTVTQIAYEVGFQDSNYFARIFRKETAESPREFRRSETVG